jgi:hypothetical protein
MARLKGNRHRNWNHNPVRLHFAFVVPMKGQGLLILSSRMIKRIAIAAAFSLFYISLYPILIGGYVIYVYPYWSPGAAIAWVAGGIVLQAWLGARPGSRRGSGLFTQVGAGLLYAFSMMMLSGGCYQS